MKWLLALLILAPPARANAFVYTWQQLAPGVWAAIREDPFELPQEGNSVFVATQQGVVVFDAGGSPAMGEAIVAKVRSVTNEPITHVVLSHWHGDHMRGLQAIQAAFPHAAILAHPFSRDFIVSTQDRWLKRRVSMVPNIRKGVDAALKNDRDLAGRPLIAAEKAWLQQGLGNTEELDRENNRTTFVVPNATFTDRLTLHLGGREIDFLHLGNAHTAGDVVMWLPQERIIATGDVVTAPIPLMPSPYPGYVAVLEQIKALDFRTLVPGHGLVQHDAAYIDLLIDTFHVVSAQMKALLAKGATKDEAIAKIDYGAVQDRYTHGDAFLANRFQDYVSAAMASAAYDAETTGIHEQF
jgi:glyoxylase-like metal-dependent hydrolase (beta-lactamase superfamily II)